MSGVLLLSRILVAFKISVLVTGEEVRLNEELLKGVNSVGDLGDGLIFLITLDAASMKNLLNASE